MSLGLLLGLLFRFLEGTPEIGKGVANVNKCRFSLFSDRKNDTYFIDTHYIYSAKHLIYSYALTDGNFEFRVTITVTV